MDKFTLYLQKFDILQNVTDEEITKSETLLRTYGPMLRSAAQGIDELEEECYAGRRQSISDFINLAIDYDRDADRQRIAGRLADMGHSMQLLSILETALLLVKDDPRHGDLYYRILSGRFFNAYCKTNEDAFLTMGIASSTYYRHIKKAVRMYAAYLWCVVIPDLILKEQLRQDRAFTSDENGNERESGSQVAEQIAVNWR